MPTRPTPPSRRTRCGLGPLVGACALAGGLLPAASALAGAPTGDTAPATWSMTPSELQAIGLGQRRADPVPVPPNFQNRRPSETDGAPELGAPGGPQQVGHTGGVLFVNFDGAQLTSGFDSSQNNVTQIGELAGAFAAYGEGAKRDAVMQAVEADWAEFNVLVTQTRPASGDYTMNMTGPTNPFGGGVLGIAPLDCDDSQTHNNITYAFHSINDGFSAAVTATTIGQEVAHSYGLEHVNAPGDIMNPQNAGGDAMFNDQCYQVVQGGNCAAQHIAECGSATSQNSYRELLTLFGPAMPDTALPTVQIVAPNDGQAFATGAEFDITVEANDDVGLQELVLFNNGAQVQTDADEPWGWGVANVPAGEYEFYVEATDLAGNVAQSNIVTVMVSDNPIPADGGEADAGGSEGGGSGGGGGGGGGDGGGGAGGGSGGGTDGALPGQFGQDEDGSDGGCACATGSRRNGGPALAWVGVLALGLGGSRRRRRS